MRFCHCSSEKTLRSACIGTCAVNRTNTVNVLFINEPRREITGLLGFLPGPTQTKLYNHRRWLEALNFGFGEKRDCTVCVAKTKALISFTVIAKLICVFVFAYAKSRFSYDVAQIEIALALTIITRFFVVKNSVTYFVRTRCN